MDNVQKKIYHWNRKILLSKNRESFVFIIFKFRTMCEKLMLNIFPSHQKTVIYKVCVALLFLIFSMHINFVI
jgi:hypothetical protein